MISNTEYLTTAKFEKRKTPVLLLVVAVYSDGVHHRLWQTSKHSTLMNTINIASMLHSDS